MPLAVVRVRDVAPLSLPTEMPMPERPSEIFSFPEKRDRTTNGLPKSMPTDRFRSSCQAAALSGVSILVLCATAWSKPSRVVRHPLFLEAYPDKIRARLQARDRLFATQSLVTSEVNQSARNTL
jgi:hypothetical protein